MGRSRHRLVAVVLLIGFAPNARAAGVADYLKKPDEWFRTAESRTVTANVLSHQSDAGGWPKNTNTTLPFAGDRKTIQPTFDNGATTDELRYLARAFAVTQDAACRTAFEKGFDYILVAQYPNGGWPQHHPPPASYHRHITFNDNAMVRLMTFLREVATEERYAFVDAARRKTAREAFDKGVGCILKCQIKADGKLTVWCAQHDEKDFTPRTARTYELPSFSGAESVGIARLLMSLENPSPEVVAAVDGAAAWFAAAKLTGIKQVVEADAKSPTGRNKVIVSDPKAPPLWARFYDITTMKPIFVDRDGVPKPTIAEIGYERRNGYAWYGNWPQKLLDDEYPAWKKKHGG